ncbi:hypothetical protein [Dendrosporobacter sp. 1207_IL3150]|uniref:hypothetical protein n=1 Tax=Dendrosporobacter sp. 1207_IL3150 TaxID=3084054 RepID=UPI002FDA16C6
MNDTKDFIQTPPLDGPSVKLIEDAILNSPTKTIMLEINNSVYQLTREGRWFKFSQLTKKRTIKRSAIYETITEIYNHLVHGTVWRIQYAGV